MKYYESDCVECQLHCIYEACPYYMVEHFKCDECWDEDIKLYHYNGREMCAECILKEFEIVDGSDF